MLTRFGGGQNVKFIESDNAVNRLISGNVRNRPNIIFGGRAALDRFDIIERSPSPRIIQQILARYERNLPTRVLTFFQKLVSFMFAGNADEMFFHTFQIQDSKFQIELI